MSSNEVLSISTPQSEKGSQERTILDMQESGEGANGSAFKDGTTLPLATREETNGLEQSLSFHHVSYLVSACCGRRTKQILDSCR